MPILLHGPGCNLGNGRDCSLVVRCWANSQSMHGLRCYNNLTPILGAWIGIFKPNSRNQNHAWCIISKLLHRFQPNLHSDKDHQTTFAGGPNAHNKSNMADSRHIGKIEKSPYLSNGLTDRHEIWHGYTVWPSSPLNFRKSKIQDGGGRHLDKSQNSHISPTIRPIATKFGNWYGDKCWSSWPCWPLKF